MAIKQDRLGLAQQACGIADGEVVAHFSFSYESYGPKKTAKLAHQPKLGAVAGSPSLPLASRGLVLRWYIRSRSYAAEAQRKAAPSSGWKLEKDYPFM